MMLEQSQEYRVVTDLPQSSLECPSKLRTLVHYYSVVRNSVCLCNETDSTK